MKRVFFCFAVAAFLFFAGAVAGAKIVILTARISGADGLYYMEALGNVHVYEESSAAPSADRPEGSGPVARAGAVNDSYIAGADPVIACSASGAVAVSMRAGARPGRAGAVAEAVSGLRADPVQPSGAVAGAARLFRSEALFRAVFPGRPSFPELFSFSPIFSAPARAKAVSYICRAYILIARSGAVADHAFPWHNGLGALSRYFM